MLTLCQHRLKQLKVDKEQAKVDKKQASDKRLQAAHSLVLRLAKFAGESASSKINFRVTSSGTPMGLLGHTTTFQDALLPEAHKTKKLLRALEDGSSSSSRSSSAMKTFQEVNCKHLI